MPELSNWSASHHCSLKHPAPSKPCRHARTFQLVNQQSLPSINNKNLKILTKRPPEATTVPSVTHRHPNPVIIPELSNWSASKDWQVLTIKTQNFYKTSACSHHCPLRHPAPSKPCRHARTFLLVRQPPLSPQAPSAIQTLSSCQNFPTGQPAKLVAMPKLSN